MAAPSAADGTGRFPYGAIIILVLAVSINSYTLTNLFPYVGMMVKHLLGLATINESGFYAGYVASAFTFGRFLSGYAWGHASDAIGRKPVIIVGLLAIVVLPVAFGLSTTFAMAVLSRFILGLLNGIMPAVRTTVREVCGPEHVVMGMTYISGSRGVGLIVGTGIGGLLAQPALHYPNTFSPTGIFGKHPFLLPNLFGACYALLVLALVIFYLPETKNSEKYCAETETRRLASAEASHKITRRSEATIGRSRSSENARSGHLAYQRLCDGGVAGEDLEEGQGGAVTVGTIIAPETVNGTEETGDTSGHNDVRAKLISKEKHEKAQYFSFDGAAAGGSEDDTESGGTTNGTTICGDGVASGTTELLSSPRSMTNGYDEQQEDPGLCGPNGLLSSPNVKMMMLRVCLLQFLIIGLDEAFPLWALSTPDVGGLGWGTVQIGKVFGTIGIFICVLQLSGVPYLVKKMGILNWQRVGSLVGVPFILSIPNAKFLSWDENSLFAVSTLTNLVVNMSIGAIMLAFTVTSTCMVPPHQRGKLGGAFMTAESLGRFLGPTSFSTTFAWSISPSAKDWVDCRFVFYISSIILVVVGAMGWRDRTLETLTKPAARGEAAATSGPIPQTLPRRTAMVTK